MVETLFTLHNVYIVPVRRLDQMCFGCGEKFTQQNGESLKKSAQKNNHQSDYAGREMWRKQCELSVPHNKHVLTILKVM